MFEILGNIIGGGDFEAPQIDSIGALFGMVINIALGVGIVIAVIAIILSGYQFIMCQGDPRKLDKAKQSLFHSVAALVLVIGAVAVKIIITNLAGITNPDLTGGTPTF